MGQELPQIDSASSSATKNLLSKAAALCQVVFPEVVAPSASLSGSSSCSSSFEDSPLPLGGTAVANNDNEDQAAAIAKAETVVEAAELQETATTSVANFARAFIFLQQVGYYVVPGGNLQGVIAVSSIVLAPPFHPSL